MVLTLQIFIVLYLLVSSMALVYYLYKNFLQYLTPVKGYLAGSLLVLSILSFDFFMFNFTADKITQLHQQNNTEISYYQ